MGAGVVVVYLLSLKGKKMRYLVFAVFSDGQGEVATHSKEYDCGFNNPNDMAEEIIADVSASGLGRQSLWEVFVFQSAQNYGDAPNQVAYWNLDDGLFGEEEVSEEDAEYPEG